MPAADSLRITDEPSYDRYVRAEWALFERDPARRTGIALPTAERVLDIGCGAGQELRPFLRNRSTFGVGIDVAPETGRAGRALFAADQPDGHVAFARATAESLPFPSAVVDVVICRLVLPYTDNRRALAEIARVLRPGGVLLLRVHHARYYLDKLVEAVRRRRIKPAVHACRVLMAGALYHLTGIQPSNRLTGRETFQTLRMLRRQLRALDLTIGSALPDSIPAAPSLLIVRGGGPSAPRASTPVGARRLPGRELDSARPSPGVAGIVHNSDVESE